jgi:endoglucanase
MSGASGASSMTPHSGGLVVRVNTVGYLPERVKRATFDGGGGSFSLVSSDGSVVFQGVASDPMASSETGETALRVADFSDFREAGEYHVEVPGVGVSPSFRIADDVYVDVFKALMQGMQGQRCGAEVTLTHDDATFEHGACHLDDAWLDAFADADHKKPTLYGWHDAGDYGKYTTNGAFSVAMMLFAWDQFQDRLGELELEIPEHGGALPDFLAECKFELDWLMSMQFEDGSVADRVTTAKYDGPVSPVASTSRRLLSPASTAATSYFVGTMARAVRAVAPFDAELAASYRDAAQRGWDYLSEHEADELPDVTVQRQFTGSYWNAGGGGRAVGDDGRRGRAEGLRIAERQRQPFCLLGLRRSVELRNFHLPALRPRGPGPEPGRLARFTLEIRSQQHPRQYPGASLRPLRW